MEKFIYYDHFEVVAKGEKYTYYPDDKKDLALLPPRIDFNVNAPVYADELQFQLTQVTLARSKKGRLFTMWFSGGDHADEDVGNYLMVMTSDVDGKTWKKNFVIAPPNFEYTRVFDGAFYFDDNNRMILHITQSYGRIDGRCGVWMTYCDDPEADKLEFTAFERKMDGISYTHMIKNKNGDLLLPVYMFNPIACNQSHKVNILNNFTTDIMGTIIYKSSDNGKSWKRYSDNILFPYVVFDEPCVAMREDGSLMMLLRGINCFAETNSYDNGKTWTPPATQFKYNFPNSHITFQKLKSGNMLMVANYKANMFSFFSGRNNLCALLSDDDGKTWKYSLMIDEREGSEQPTFSEGEDGYVYVGYGRAPQMAGESMMAIINEKDVLAGKIVSPQSKLRVLVHKAKGIERREDFDVLKQIADDNGIEMDTKL